MSRSLAAMLKLATGQVALRACAISAAIIIVALVADLVVNVWLMPGVTPYTPLGTLLIALLITPPFVLALMLQTEQVRQTQQHLAREQSARLAAEAVNAARTRFLANLSHELRTPLNAIIGYSELMAEAADEDGRRQDVEDHGRVMGGARRLMQLLNDLLDLAKLEAGRLTLRLDDFDVRVLIEESVERVRADIERNRNVLDLQIDPRLAHGHSDAHRLGQCLLNLLSNAAKFTADGIITVTARAELSEQADAETWLAISVADTGIGIARERQVLLFEPFLQAETPGADAGSGLGLALTRQLAGLLGGDVSLESEAGKGARFTLRVPLYGPRPAVADAASARAAAA